MAQQSYGLDDGSSMAQPSSASNAGMLRTLESSLLNDIAGGLDTQIAKSEMSQGASGRFQGGASLQDMGSPPSGWPAFVNGARPGEGFDNDLGRGGLYDDPRLIEQLADATRKPMSQSGPWRGPTAGSQQEPPGIRRPETPILAYVDRASMPGFVDCDEKEARFQQMDREREIQQASSWSAPPPAAEISSLDEWEAELAEWKRKYGCADAPSADIDFDAAISALVAPAAPAATDQEPQAPPAPASRSPIEFSESMLNTDIDIAELNPPPLNPLQGSRQQSPFQPSTPQNDAGPRPATQETTAILQSALGDGPGSSLRQGADVLDQAQREQQQKLASPTRAQEQGRQEPIAGAGGFAVAAQSSALMPRPPSTPQNDAGARPATNGRRLEYTAQDLEVAADTAKMRVKSDGGWKSEYSETGLQKRDFFMDIRRQREKDKGRQATGPLWIHLAKQVKNLANTLDLSELLEALKLFASVRFEDYELYMRLLGEVPQYVTQATALQLCELVRILARRRLRERNYVDMVCGQLLRKIRNSEDNLPARQLVKIANALAALECRSNPKFVEHFLRYMEHRIQEFDAKLCCLVAPIFVDQYMNDALRRAYLVRCAEVHAGFNCPLEEARNVACTELILRKECHSLVVSLPPHVVRYLEKIQRHAQFDKWGAVTMPTSVAPDGPKGTERAEMSMSLQLKASTAEGVGKQADVFSSDMHRDVSACLSHLGCDHENGVLAGPYLLDVVAQDMVTPTKRIVFEINSPHHYYEGTQQLTAEKRLRHRMINRLGHKIHQVNADEWKKLSTAQKMTHMLKLQQDQQDENAREEKQKAAANTSRAPLPALPLTGPSTRTDPLRLKCIGDLRQPIRIPVPPSKKARQPVSERGAYG